MLSAFFEMLEAVGKEVESEAKVKWEIDVEEGSQIVHAYPKSDNQEFVANLVDQSIPNGLTVLEKGSSKIPKYFNPRSIKSARRLAHLGGKGENAIPIEIKAGRKKTKITENIISKTNDLVGTQHQAYGDIEGRLRMLTDFDGGVKFAIYQKLYKTSVSCNVPDDLIDELGELFRKRVVVSGRIQYNVKGNPVSMSVVKIQRISENDDLPKLEEMRGILA